MNKPSNIERGVKIGAQVVGYALIVYYSEWQVALGVALISIATLLASKLSVYNEVNKESK